jgi:hypothetical protein
MNDRAFYRRGHQWVDSRLVGGASRVRPTRVIEFGSADFTTLALRLARDGRQGCISLSGEILLEVDGQPILVRGPQGK